MQHVCLFSLFIYKRIVEIEGWFFWWLHLKGLKQATNYCQQRVGGKGVMQLLKWDTYQYKCYWLSSLSYQRSGGFYHLTISYLVAAKTNMEVLWEVVKAEAKLVVKAKLSRVSAAVHKRGYIKNQRSAVLWWIRS